MNLTNASSGRLTCGSSPLRLIVMFQGVKVNMLKIIIGVIFVAIPLFVNADSDQYCTYLMYFGLSNTDTKAKLEEYSLKDCKEGDVVNIHIKDSDNLNREEMYLASEVAEICDNNHQITVIGKDRAVCTYRGSRRSIRRSR